MPLQVRFHKALKRAPCLFLGALLVIAAPENTPATQPCASERYDETVHVQRVIDGDTLVLEDKRLLRLIAVNTPERAKDNKPAEPLAEEARHYLRERLAKHAALHLRYDNERHDRYDRLLAHAFLDDGRNLSELLLQAGLGFHIAVPPNLWALECYQGSERQARHQHRGVWGLPYFQPRPVTALSAETTGFHRISGTVTRIGESRNALWLNLGRGFALRLPRSSLHNFTTSPRTLKGKTLTVRGWIYTRKGELRMNLRHPAAIERVTP